MGTMFGFSKKKPVTADVKNALNRELSHLDKALETIRTADTIKIYCNAVRDMLLAYQKLDKFEKEYDWKKGKYTWKGGVQKSIKSIQVQITAKERSFIDRAYQKLEFDCAGLSTEKAKENRRNKFFDEVKAYSMFFDEKTLAYVDSLKNSPV